MTGTEFWSLADFGEMAGKSALTWQTRIAVVSSDRISSGLIEVFEFASCANSWRSKKMRANWSCHPGKSRRFANPGLFTDGMAHRTSNWSRTSKKDCPTKAEKFRSIDSAF